MFWKAMVSAQVSVQAQVNPVTSSRHVKATATSAENQRYAMFTGTCERENFPSFRETRDYFRDDMFTYTLRSFTPPSSWANVFRCRTTWTNLSWAMIGRFHSCGWREDDNDNNIGDQRGEEGWKVQVEKPEIIKEKVESGEEKNGDRKEKDELSLSLNQIIMWL